MAKSYQGGDMMNVLHSELQDELEVQDEYLTKLGLARHEVYPDENSFFRAVRTSAKSFLRHSATPAGKVSHESLRKAAVEKIQYYLAKYKEFFHGQNVKQIHEELGFIEDKGALVGFESLMALTQVLSARILVSYGGSEACPDVITKAFYFGSEDELPEKYVHIIWVSLGYYDAVVPAEYKPEKPVNTVRYIVDHYAEVGLEVLKSRKPCHTCACPRGSSACPWKTYKYDEQLRGGSEPSSPSFKPEFSRSTSNKSYRSLPDDSDEEEEDGDHLWDDIFIFLTKSGPVLSSWRMMCCRLKVDSGRLTEIDHEYRKLSEKLIAGLEAWRMAASIDNYVGFQKLITALRKEKFNLTADQLEEKYEGRFK